MSSPTERLPCDGSSPVIAAPKTQLTPALAPSLFADENLGRDRLAPDPTGGAGIWTGSRVRPTCPATEPLPFRYALSPPVRENSPHQTQLGLTCKRLRVRGELL